MNKALDELLDLLVDAAIQQLQINAKESETKCLRAPMEELPATCRKKHQSSTSLETVKQ
jgi:hypothetical protein